MKNNAESKSSRFLYRSLILLCQKQSPTAQGYILFLIISVSIALSGLLVAYALLAKVHSISMKSSADSNSGFYSAEAALNVRAEQLRSIFIDYRTPTGTPPQKLSFCMDANNSNDGTGDYSCQAQTFAAANSASDSLSAYSYVVDSTNYQNGQPPMGTVPPGESFQNLNMLEYRYSISSVAKKTNASTDQVTAMTEMAIKSRLIPMFQFAAFYLNDLEIVPGAAMNLNGPIHTNGNLYLGGTQANFLNINGQVTLSKNLYNSRKSHSETFPDGNVRIMDVLGTFLNLLSTGTGSTSQTTAAMSPNKVAAAWGSQVKIGVDALSIPDAGILGLSGDYYQKADLKILYTPGSNATDIPFEMTSISRTPSGSISSTTVLTEGERRSLLQPVLVSKNLAGIPNSNYTPGCNPSLTPFNPGSGITLTSAQRTALASTLYRAIVSLKIPYAYYGWDRSFIIGNSSTVVNSLNTVVNTFTNLTPAQRTTLRNNLASTTSPVTAGSVAALNDPNDRCALNPGVTLTDDQKATLANALYIVMVSQTTPIAFNEGKPSFSVGTSLNSIVDTFTNLTTTEKDTLKANLTASNPAAIAALDGRFFVSAPIQDIGRTTSPAFRNDRETRDMRLLQINIESLAIWNKVGRYVTFSSGSVTDNNSGLGFSADQRIFATANADNSATVGSFQNLGLVGSDTSEGGFVFHATINQTTYPSANGNQSPYGFALVQAQQLPGLAKIGNSDPTGLTFVSDQAVYVQGDYNTVNWQPASILADSLNVLSNACLNINSVIHKASGANCNTGNGAAKIAPTPTTINSAFLSGTDITTCNTGTTCYNGGLENYPRFSEGWGGVLLTYRGSFVSTSTPIHVRGTWSSQLYGAPNRNWDYDTRFNAAENLPPLAPRFVYLKQESFSRNFNQQ
jgi:hypothetical protein